MNNSHNKSSIYFRFSLLIFVFFFVLIVLVGIIICIVLMSPFAPLLMHGFASTTIFTMLIILLASAILASMLFYFLGRKPLSSLVDLSVKSKEVAQGNFSSRVKVESNIPELNEVLKNFNYMVENLSKLDTLSNDFISNVSHEFKTPLAVIRSNVNILENASLSEEEKQKCLTRINDSIEKLTVLISNVLKISKLDNNQVEVDLKEVRLDEVLRQCILDLSDRFEKKHLILDLELDDCLIKSDKELLAQIVNNLITNAIKFSNEGGTIYLSLENSKQIVITVKDEGIGMSQETVNHIFDRFYQGETSHSREGNGLGLTIVSKIVKILNGKIEVSSKINEGTTFKVIFPKSQLVKQ